MPKIGLRTIALLVHHSCMKDNEILLFDLIHLKITAFNIPVLNIAHIKNLAGKFAVFQGKALVHHIKMCTYMPKLLVLPIILYPFQEFIQHPSCQFIRQINAHILFLLSDHFHCYCYSLFPNCNVIS
ncbi:hypothetical protein DSY0561 [Desulfitobacterium hafniense Y51]|uniref:Uncharacterized protein n=1 Tax=Desulfitobacterium hafniense (strain Y51) TaxID=138119 RepID=Q250E2_DESHY|nr:hypothetical protein DSY0561 [Desulfitobacterium hafniense Y51]